MRRAFVSHSTADGGYVAEIESFVRALSFFSEGRAEEKESKTFAASNVGAFKKGQRLARIVGQRRSPLILDGFQPLQYAPTSPTPGQLKDQNIAALLKRLAAASQGPCARAIGN